jgi:hypothetical protein
VKISGQHLKPPTDLDVARSLAHMQHELREKYVTCGRELQRPGALVPAFLSAQHDLIVARPAIQKKFEPLSIAP